MQLLAQVKVAPYISAKLDVVRGCTQRVRSGLCFPIRPDSLFQVETALTMGLVLLTGCGMVRRASCATKVIMALVASYNGPMCSPAIAFRRFPWAPILCFPTALWCTMLSRCYRGLPSASASACHCLGFWMRQASPTVPTITQPKLKRGCPQNLPEILPGGRVWSLREVHPKQCRCSKTATSCISSGSTCWVPKTQHRA